MLLKSDGFCNISAKRDTTLRATLLQVQRTDNRASRIMASSKATALVSEQQTGLTKTLNQNKSSPRKNRLIKP